MAPRIKDSSLLEYLDLVMENSLGERRKDAIAEGDKTMREVLNELAGDVKHPTFNRRLSRYLERNQKVIKPFENGFHKQQFENQVTDKNRSDNNYLAAIYLLTSEEKTWRAIREFVNKNGIKYDLVEDIPTDNGYALFQIAKDLTDGTRHITLADIADSKVIKPQMFMVICKALAISIYGAGAVGIRPVNPVEDMWLKL